MYSFVKYKVVRTSDPPSLERTQVDSGSYQRSLVSLIATLVLDFMSSNIRL